MWHGMIGVLLVLEKPGRFLSPTSLDSCRRLSSSRYEVSLAVNACMDGTYESTLLHLARRTGRLRSLWCPAWWICHWQYSQILFGGGEG